MGGGYHWRGGPSVPGPGTYIYISVCVCFWNVLQVERFKCAICLLVARDALAHECGSVLFCESCWKKCMAKETGPKSNQLLDFLFVS